MADISAEERQRRRRAAESVIGTHAMEGISLDPKVHKLLDAFSEGEITLEEFSNAIDRLAQPLVASRRPLAGAA